MYTFINFNFSKLWDWLNVNFNLNYWTIMLINDITLKFIHIEQA